MTMVSPGSCSSSVRLTPPSNRAGNQVIHNVQSVREARSWRGSPERARTAIVCVCCRHPSRQGRQPVRHRSREKNVKILGFCALSGQKQTDEHLPSNSSSSSRPPFLSGRQPVLCPLTVTMFEEFCFVLWRSTNDSELWMIYV